MTRARYCFFFGTMAAWGAVMFQQDSMGLEAYKAYLDAHWMNLHWGVGAAVCLFGILGGVYAMMTAPHEDDVYSG